MKYYNDFKEFVWYHIYTKLLIPYKAKELRKKPVIKVLFVITELGCWKTENLYLKMLNSDRFNPQLVILPSTECEEAQEVVIEYVKKKGYKYKSLKDNSYLQTEFSPDIIFYQKPYYWVIPERYTFRYNFNSLFCYVDYCFHNVNEKWALSQPLHNYSWQVYFENSICATESKKYMRNGGRNIKITGLPFMDGLLKDKSEYNDPWKKQSKRLKRVIWAPHHTIPNKHGNKLNYSTFLEYCDYFLELAHKYEDKIQFAFKPHPLLKPKLYELWGKERTENYFKEWDSYSNTQYENGEYIDLFKYSDAMIHDSASFMVEYHYTLNPVMFLTKGIDVEDNLNEFTKYAYSLHYKGKNKSDIEKFLLDLLSQKDSLLLQRKEFYKSSLTIPYGNSACENIMNSILGIKNT